MGKFNQGDKFSSRKRFGNDRGSGQSMHQAICTTCGKSCEVPFKPSGDKPVYCSDCFSKKDGGNRFDRRDAGRPSFGEKKMFAAVCDKCGKECEVPFRPTGDKPVYCNNCFDRGSKGSGNKPAGGDQFQKQLDQINNKLDNILRILSPKIVVEKTVREAKPVVNDIKKIVAKKVEPKKAVVKKAVAVKKSAKKVVAKKKK